MLAEMQRKEQQVLNPFKLTEWDQTSSISNWDRSNAEIEARGILDVLEIVVEKVLINWKEYMYQ